MLFVVCYEFRVLQGLGVVLVVVPGEFQLLDPVLEVVSVVASCSGETEQEVGAEAPYRAADEQHQQRFPAQGLDERVQYAAEYARHQRNSGREQLVVVPTHAFAPGMTLIYQCRKRCVSVTLVLVEVALAVQRLLLKCNLVLVPYGLHVCFEGMHQGDKYRTQYTQCHHVQKILQVRCYRIPMSGSRLGLWGPWVRQRVQLLLLKLIMQQRSLVNVDIFPHKLVLFGV